MINIGIAEISKQPSIFDKIDEVAIIENKKSKEVKGFFIPIYYKKYIENVIKEIEYQKFKDRNSSLVKIDDQNFDETLLDGLDDKY